MPEIIFRFVGDGRDAERAANAVRGALNGVEKEQHQLAAASNKAHREMSQVTRGAAAGTGIFQGFGRSLAFASAGFLTTAGLVHGLRQSIEHASNLNEQINKANVVFRENGKTVVEWSKSSANAMGIARDQAIAYAATFGNLLVPMGVSRKEAASLSTQIVQLAADMASFNNASPEEVLHALQSGLAGQVRPLRQFGVFLSQDRIAAEALSSGLVKANVDIGKVADANTKVAIAEAKLANVRKTHAANSVAVAQAEVALHTAERNLHTVMAGNIPQLTAQQKVMATYRLIVKDTADAHNDFARTSGGLANQQRILKAQIADVEERIGTALMPTVLKITKAVTEWLGKSENMERIQRDVNTAVEKGGEIINAAWPVVKTIAEHVQDVVDAMGGWNHAIEVFLAYKILTRLSGIQAGLAGAGGKGGILGSLRLLTAAPWQITLAVIGAIALRKLMDEMTNWTPPSWLTYPFGNNLQSIDQTTAAAAQRYVSLGKDKRHPLYYDPATDRLGLVVGKDFMASSVFKNIEAAAKQAGITVDELKKKIAAAKKEASAGVLTTPTATQALTAGSPAGGLTPGGLQLPVGSYVIAHETHPTANLPGFPAVDVMATAGTPVGAPEAGLIVRLSGKSPAAGGKEGGAFGYSIYLLGQSGTTYFMTHFGTVNVKPGQKVTRGFILGTVADWAAAGLRTPPHIHIGAHSGKIDVGGGSTITTGGGTGAGTGAGGTGDLTVDTGGTTKAPPLYPGQVGLETALGDARLTKRFTDDLTVLLKMQKAIADARKNARGERRQQLDAALLDVRKDIQDAQEKIMGPPLTVAQLKRVLPVGAVFGGGLLTPAQRAETKRAIESTLGDIRKQRQAMLDAIAEATPQAEAIRGALSGLSSGIAVAITDEFGRAVGDVNVGQLRAQVDQLMKTILDPRTTAAARKAAVAELAKLGPEVSAIIDRTKEIAQSKDLGSSMLDVLSGLSGNLTAELRDRWGRVTSVLSLAQVRARIMADLRAITTGTVEQVSAAIADLALLEPVVQGLFDQAAQAAEDAYQAEVAAAQAAHDAAVEQAQAAVDAMQEIVNQAQQAVEAARGDFERELQRAFSLGTRVFEAQTQEMLDAFDQTTAALQKQFDDYTETVRQGFAETAALQTPAERELAALRALRSAQTLDAGITGAQASVQSLRDQLNQAIFKGDQAEIARLAAALADAQKTLDNAILDQREADLSVQADLERKAADAAHAAELQTFEDQRALQSTELAKQRADLRRALELERQVAADNLQLQEEDIIRSYERGEIDARTAQDRIVALLNSYGVTYAEAGRLLGDAFRVELVDAFDRTAKASDVLGVRLDALAAAMVNLKAAIDALHSKQIEVVVVTRLVTVHEDEPAPASPTDPTLDSPYPGLPGLTYAQVIQQYGLTGAIGGAVTPTAHLQHGGFVRGVDLGYDSEPAMLRPGELVLHEGQQGRVGRTLERAIGLARALEEAAASSQGRAPIVIENLTTIGTTPREIWESVARKTDPWSRGITSYPIPGKG